MNSQTAKPLSIEYDRLKDIVTIEGNKYSGELFRGLGLVTHPGLWIRVTKVEDGLIHLEEKTEHLIADEWYANHHESIEDNVPRETNNT